MAAGAFDLTFVAGAKRHAEEDTETIERAFDAGRAANTLSQRAEFAFVIGLCRIEGLIDVLRHLARPADF